MPKAWKPGMDKPPWTGENNALRDWTFYQLEDFYYTYRAPLDHKAGRTPIDPEADDATILELLDSGDDSEHEHGLALLHQLASRLLGPAIADRIQWKRKRGRPKGKPLHTRPPKHPWTYDYPAKLHMAKLAVPIIRRIWREHYGKWQRSRGNIDAYQIAAEYFCVDEAAVRAKPSGRHKPKNKQS